MAYRKIFTTLTALAVYASAITGFAQGSNSGATIIDRKLLRVPEKPISNRPKAPSLNTDYIAISIIDNMLHVAYPANSLPATVQIVDKLSGFTVFSGTAINNESIDISNLGKGEFILTVTLVDNRVYSGIMEIE